MTWNCLFYHQQNKKVKTTTNIIMCIRKMVQCFTFYSFKHENCSWAWSSKKKTKHCCQEERARVQATVILHAGSTASVFCSHPAERGAARVLTLHARPWCWCQCRALSAAVEHEECVTEHPALLLTTPFYKTYVSLNIKTEWRPLTFSSLIS